MGGHVVRHFLPSFPASVAGVGEASAVDLKVLVRDASSASARALEKDFLAYSHPKGRFLLQLLSPSNPRSRI